jgi:uncharacterized membrane protein
MHRRGARSAALAPLFAAWLGFLPNAPYLVTDFIHLRFRLGAPVWFDAVLLATFAWAGVGLGAASLRLVTSVVRARNGAWASSLFVVAAALLTGFGVYLGRFLRLNTWDVVARPLVVAEEVFGPLLDPFAHPRAWAVTLTFALFFLVVSGLFGAPRRRVEAPSGAP